MEEEIKIVQSEAPWQYPLDEHIELLLRDWGIISDSTEVAFHVKNSNYFIAERSGADAIVLDPHALSVGIEIEEYASTAPKDDPVHGMGIDSIAEEWQDAIEKRLDDLRLDPDDVRVILFIGPFGAVGWMSMNLPDAQPKPFFFSDLTPLAMIRAMEKMAKMQAMPWICAPSEEMKL